MSLSVKVQKDIGSYEEKVIGKLSFRTLLCVSGGLAMSVLTAAAVHFLLNLEVADAALPIMLTSLPFWLAGFYRPHHMAPEKFLPLFLTHHFGENLLLNRPLSALTGPVSSLIPGKPSRGARRMTRGKGVEHREPKRQCGDRRNP